MVNGMVTIPLCNHADEWIKRVCVLPTPVRDKLQLQDGTLAIGEFPRGRGRSEYRSDSFAANDTDATQGWNLGNSHRAGFLPVAVKETHPAFAYRAGHPFTRG